MTLLHDIRVPPLNRGSVHNGDAGVRQGNRFDNTAGSFICVIGELSSYSADSIQLWYSDEMGKLPESGSNLVFGILTGGYGKKVCGAGALISMKKTGLSRFGSMTKVIAKPVALMPLIATSEVGYWGVTMN